MNSRQHNACEAIERESFDFTATFYATHDLHAMALRDVTAISVRTVAALKGLLLGNAFQDQRQRLFLYREAAGVLSTIIQFGRTHPIAKAACRALNETLRRGCGQAHRAAAEALGSLPLQVKGPALPPLHLDDPPEAGWRDVTALVSCRIGNTVRWIGRSIVVDLSRDRVMVVKVARRESDRHALLSEVRWMQYLANLSLPPGVRFDVPVVLPVKGSPLFRLMRFPAGRPAGNRIGQRPLAIGFTVSRNYFSYPNPCDPLKLPAARGYVEVMARNAFLLGNLAAKGIVHESPIPLFHNRVQQVRRRDGGVYEWFRAGRLDRWLDSCAYPNFGFSGLRDFEHFQSFAGNSSELYRLLGNHLLSLLLVGGSYFRAKNPCCRGWSADGRPVDARKYFDRQLLSEAILAIFGQYHAGFVGRPCRNIEAVDIDALVVRIIEEMGVDRHMEEHLRVADQRRMTRAAFESFLTERGYSREAVSSIRRGARDLSIQTGPHLGAFNRGISIPELIEAAAAVAATCILERFLLPGNHLIHPSQCGDHVGKTGGGHAQNNGVQDFFRTRAGFNRFARAGHDTTA